MADGSGLRDYYNSWCVYVCVRFDFSKQWWIGQKDLRITSALQLLDLKRGFFRKTASSRSYRATKSHALGVSLTPSDDFSSSHAWNGNFHASEKQAALHLTNKCKETFNCLAVNFLKNLTPVSTSNSSTVTFERWNTRFHSAWNGKSVSPRGGHVAMTFAYNYTWEYNKAHTKA